LKIELLMDRRPLNIEASDRHPKLLLSSGHHRLSWTEGLNES
jgi:hypothetical protein